MKKLYNSPEISVEFASDIITTSQYVETNMVTFPDTQSVSSGSRNADVQFAASDDLFNL